MSDIKGFRATVYTKDGKVELSLALMQAACTLLTKRGDERLTFSTKEIEEALTTAATVLDLATPHIVVEKRSIWDS